MTRSRETVWALGLAMLAACGGEADQGGSELEVTRSDSAGVEIVMSSRPAWEASGKPWRLSPEPVLEIGTMEGDGPEIFQRIADVEVADDGRVWVADNGDGTVRIFDSGGEHVRTVGGEGEGPGESTSLSGLEAGPGWVLAYQSLPRPIHRWDLDGELLQSERLELPPEAGRLQWSGLVARPDGWAAAVWGYPSVMLEGDGLFVPETAMELVPLGEGEAVPVGRFPVVHAIGGPFNGWEWQKFGPSLRVQACGDLLWVAWTGDYSLAGYDGAGRLTRIVRRAWTPPPVTEEERRAWREGRMENIRGAPARARPSLEARMDAMVFPDHHEAHDRLLCGAEGRLWVMRADPDLELGRTVPQIPLEPTRWDVFAADGSWLGTIDVPARFLPTAVTPDRVFGVHLSELDVPFVRAYTLEKGQGGRDR